MEQYPDKKREKIKQYQKVIITKSEFKKACELDSGELTNIRNEFFKRTFVYPLIGIIFAAVLFVLWLNGIIQMLFVYSDIITTVVMFLVAFCIAMSAFWTVRCIDALIFVSKINKQDFYWRVGHITARRRLWTVKYLRMDFYYIIDDEYCSRTVFDPIYRKGTEVYFLCFPGFWESALIGGIVVKKHD